MTTETCHAIQKTARNRMFTFISEVDHYLVEKFEPRVVNKLGMKSHAPGHLEGRL